MTNRLIVGDFVGREMTVTVPPQTDSGSHLDARPRDNPEGLLANWVINLINFIDLCLLLSLLYSYCHVLGL